MKATRLLLKSSSSLLNKTPQASNRWQRLFRETRTRVLFLYLLTMLSVTAIATPIFQHLLFRQIGVRVREDLVEETYDFKEDYLEWVSTAGETDKNLKEFVNEFIRQGPPEDDNFHAFYVDNKFYRANPPGLPESIRPDSELMNEWLTLAAAEPADSDAFVIARGEYPAPDPGVGSILYKIIALNIDDERQGLLIATHFTSGEREEALAGVYVFSQVAIGVVLASFLLAWLCSRQLFAPVRSLATAARSISEENLSERLDVNGKGELADLSFTFNDMMNRLQNAFESQRNFINDASHELRTPITIIQGHLELMGTDPIEQQETLGLVMDELDRMSRFVNDLLLLTKSERPDFLRLETIDVADLTDEIGNKAIAMTSRDWTINTHGHGKMVGDRQRITGALLNLITNAIQHTQETDTIELCSKVINGTVRFSVRDTGEGIAPHDQARIFERFSRTSNSYRRSEGAGLGLAIVKAIVEAHRGHIELVSKPGVGSTFTLIFPLG
ncbi:MAG: HAMP domain-containing sensor histidine kinase [Cyanobacteria bacterium J06633_2]